MIYPFNEEGFTHSHLVVVILIYYYYDYLNYKIHVININII